LAKIGKWSIALAFTLALLMLAGSLSPTSLWDGLGGLTSMSSLVSSCGMNLSQQQGYARMAEWLGLSLVAIMVGMAWATIGQVLSGTFGGPKYNQFVKGMLWSGVETAALLGILAIMFGTLWEYGDARLQTARAYAVLAKNTVMFDFSLMLGANMIAGFVTNLNPYFKLPGKVFMSVGFQVAPMFKPIIDILGVTMQLITTAVALWAAQEFLLCFVQGSMLAILLPAGFFLRGFGLNAGGNALIAISLSMFFIYPHMMIMLGESVSAQLEGDLKSNNVPQSNIWMTQCLDKPICCVHDAAPQGGADWLAIPNGPPPSSVSVSQINHGLFNIRLNPATGSSLGNYCIYNTVLANAYRATLGLVSGTGLLGVAGGAALAGLLKYMNISWLSVGVMVPLAMFAFYAIMEMVYFVFILTIIVPIFIVFVTLTIAKELAKVLGTEIDLSSLEKLI